MRTIVIIYLLLKNYTMNYFNVWHNSELMLSKTKILVIQTSESKYLEIVFLVVTLCIIIVGPLILQKVEFVI